MEVGIDPAIPTYSGGLGVLSGDMLRSAADMNIPMVGVTLLHWKGYFRQKLDEYGNQIEQNVEWEPKKLLEQMEPQVTVTLEGRRVNIRAWRYTLKSDAGYKVPVYFLDTFLPENAAQDQKITDHLYGGDERYRLSQEIVLGIGGVTMLRALGHTQLRVYHMNEGHSALLTLALLMEKLEKSGLGALTEEDKEAVRQQCVFTTHTPVPAGHDKFPMSLVRELLEERWIDVLKGINGEVGGMLNMTNLALTLSRYVNGVAMRHGQISRDMFPGYPINSITNGVHAVTWTSVIFQRLYDHYIPEWRRDNLYLRYAISIPLREIMKSHRQAKEALLKEVECRTKVRLNSDVMTIGFARRATAYKRADLIFHNIDRLKKIVSETGPIQIIFGGKAHPKDGWGKAMIKRIFEAREALQDSIQIVYLEEYDMTLAKYLCSGVDLWLNTPHRPYEASGTSGMKAALNGVPSLSVLDGWWIEGHIEGVTGWSIGDSRQTVGDPVAESASLYDKLEQSILPLFYLNPEKFADIMRSTIALNGSFFNTQRMMSQYMQNAYLVTSQE